MHRLALGTIAVKGLEKIFRCLNVSISTKIRTVQGLLFPNTVYGSKSWKKQDKKSIDVFEPLCWRRLLRVPWIEEINPKFSLEVQMTKFKSSYNGHIMQRPSSHEKSIMVGKLEGKKRMTRSKSDS